MTTMTATQARQNLFDLLKKSVRGHAPIKITSKSGDAVLISEEDYEGLLETLELLSSPGFRKSLKRSVAQMHRGETVSFEEVFGAAK